MVLMKVEKRKPCSWFSPIDVLRQVLRHLSALNSVQMCRNLREESKAKKDGKDIWIKSFACNFNDVKQL